MNLLKDILLGVSLLLAATVSPAATDSASSLTAINSMPTVELPEFKVKGDQFLGIKNGSLIESIYFRNIWIKDHPEEDAIILVTSADGKDGKYPPVTAVTVYSQKGKVLAHCSDYGPVLLDTLNPDDLKRNAAHCLDEYLKTVARLPLKPVPAVGTSDEQVQRAFDAVHDPETMPYFPVALADIPGKIKKAEGTFENTTLKCLVFDWNDAHYLWRPSMGAHREDPPIEPLTGRPLLCVNHSDLVESLIFVYDYRKAHPDEKAVLLYAPYFIDHEFFYTIGMASAAYTMKGVVHIRGYFSGDFVPNNSAHPFKPVDLDRPERLALLYQQYRSINWRIFYTKYKEIFPSSPIQDKIKFELYDTLHSSFPQSLPGDTAEMQQNRIFQRATEAGIPCGIECNKTNGRVVVLHWLSQRFCYTEDYNKTEKSLSYYNGVRSPNDIACLIDAVLFTQDFKANHPSDTVLVLPYREPGLWEIVKAVTVFVRNGKVYAHNPQVSDAPIPKTKPADLDDPNEFRALRLAGNNAINTIESVKTAEDTTALIQKFCQELKCWVKANGNPDSEATDRYIYEILMRPSNMSNVEVLSVYEKLKAAGVDCQLYASTAERKPDGRIIEYSLPSLGFTFHGARYTYGPEHYCSAANNLILDP